MGRLILITNSDGVLAGAATTPEEILAVCQRVAEAELVRDLDAALKKSQILSALPPGTQVSDDLASSVLRSLEGRGLIPDRDALTRKILVILTKCSFEVVS